MSRIDAVYVRKSSDPQEEQSQLDAILGYLDQKKISVPKEYWFSETGQRHRPEEREQFQRLVALVENGQVRRVFIWKQDRMGSGTHLWFHYLYYFSSTGTELIDVLTEKDLAAEDAATEITTAVTARGDREFQTKLADNVLRKKINLAKEGMPQCRVTPFGFDKRYIDSTGKHLWTLHTAQIGRGKGQTRYLVIMPDDSRHDRTVAPRKSKSDRIVYVPSIATDRIATVRYIFETFASESITTSKLAQRLNQLPGRDHYGMPWLRTTLEDILRNPVYIGTVRNNHTSQAEFSRFDGTTLVKAKNPERKTYRNPAEAVIVVPGKHESLVKRPVWDRVQQKLDERGRRAQPPRREDLWLRGVLYCGGCDRPMHLFSSKKKGVKGYICGSYYRFNQTRSEADFTGCTRNWIPHERAEELVTKRIGNLLDMLGKSSEMESLNYLLTNYIAAGTDIEIIIRRGVNEYLRNLQKMFEEADDPDTADRFEELLARAAGVKRCIQDSDLAARLDKYASEVLTVEQVRKLFIVFEEEKVGLAESKIADLNAEFTLWQRAKAKADTEREEANAVAKLREIEDDLERWESRTKPLDDQLADLRTKLAEHFEQLREAQAAIRSGTTRKKAEIVRGLFSRVVLHFEKVKKTKINDAIFRPEKTEFVVNGADGSASRTRRVSSPGGPGCRSSAGSR